MGFLILLTIGNNSQNKNKASDGNDFDDDDNVDDNSVLLPFAALTDGNIIDACFGNQAQGGIKFAGSTYSIKAATCAKQILNEFAELDQHHRHKYIAINAYKKCFEVVIDYHNKIESLGLISTCWKAQTMRRKAEDDLRLSFSPLIQAILQCDLQQLPSISKAAAVEPDNKIRGVCCC